MASFWRSQAMKGYTETDIPENFVVLEDIGNNFDSESEPGSPGRDDPASPSTQRTPQLEVEPSLPETSEGTFEGFGGDFWAPARERFVGSVEDGLRARGSSQLGALGRKNIFVDDEDISMRDRGLAPHGGVIRNELLTQNGAKSLSRAGHGKRMVYDFNKRAATKEVKARGDVDDNKLMGHEDFRAQVDTVEAFDRRMNLLSSKEKRLGCFVNGLVARSKPKKHKKQAGDQAQPEGEDMVKKQSTKKDGDEVEGKQSVRKDEDEKEQQRKDSKGKAARGEDAVEEGDESEEDDAPGSRWKRRTRRLAHRKKSLVNFAKGDQLEETKAVEGRAASKTSAVDASDAASDVASVRSRIVRVRREDRQLTDKSNNFYYDDASVERRVDRIRSLTPSGMPRMDLGGEDPSEGDSPRSQGSPTSIKRKDRRIGSLTSNASVMSRVSQMSSVAEGEEQEPGASGSPPTSTGKSLRWRDSVRGGEDSVKGIHSEDAA